MGPTVEDRVLDYGDEWLPQNVTLDGMSEFQQRARARRQRAADAGRGTIPMTMFAAQPDRDAVAGVTRCLFALPTAPEDTILPKLDDLAGLTR